MKKVILFLCATLCSSFALASKCDHSMVSISNLTDETLVLGNLNPVSRSGWTKSYGTASAYNGISINPGATYKFEVNSASGTAGTAYGSFSLGGQYGSSNFDYTFLPDGLIFTNCWSDSMVTNGNPKYYSISQTRTDGIPGMVTFKVKSRKQNASSGKGG